MSVQILIYVPSTIHHYSLVVSTFCRWLEYEGTIEKPITERFKLPKLEQSFIPTFMPDDVQKLLEVCSVSPHNCRRYMATTQLSMGRSPLDVQRQMGHTSLNMTNRYASFATSQLQKSHEEYSATF